jgi:hypothetical protein
MEAVLVFEGRDLRSLAKSGFLVDPEGEYGKQLHPNLMPFARLEGIPWLALLKRIDFAPRPVVLSETPHE